MAARLILNLSVEISADCANEEEAALYATAFKRFIRTFNEDQAPHPLYIDCSTEFQTILTSEGA